MLAVWEEIKFTLNLYKTYTDSQGHRRLGILDCLTLCNTFPA